MAAILLYLEARTRAGSLTTFFKFLAHNFCEFNAAADSLAERAALLPLEQGRFAELTRERGLQYAKWDPVAYATVSTAAARGAGLLAHPTAHQIRSERCACAHPSYTADFLRRGHDYRDMLGRAF